MYQPNFCCDCGAKILRLHWRAWTSRRFCDLCSKRLLKQRLTNPSIAGTLLLSIGIIAGRAGRPAPPPLIIERSANPTFYNQQSNGTTRETDGTSSSESINSNPPQSLQAMTEEELVYICGARTKKGTPCARRVHSAVRCWQHKGAPAILRPEKLKVQG